MFCNMKVLGYDELFEVNKGGLKFVWRDTAQARFSVVPAREVVFQICYFTPQIICSQVSIPVVSTKQKQQRIMQLLT